MAHPCAGQPVPGPAALPPATGGPPLGWPPRPRPGGKRRAGRNFFPAAGGPDRAAPVLLRGLLHGGNRGDSERPSRHGALPAQPGAGPPADASERRS